MNKFQEITGLQASPLKTCYMHGNAHVAWSYWYDKNGDHKDKHKHLDDLVDRYNSSIRKRFKIKPDGEKVALPLNQQVVECCDRYGNALHEGDIVLAPTNMYMHNEGGSRIDVMDNDKLNAVARHSGATGVVTPAIVYQYGERVAFIHLKTSIKDVAYNNHANYFYPKRYVKISFEQLNGFEKKQYLETIKSKYLNGNSEDTIRRNFNFFNRG